jgi:hypothetical protein
MVYAVCPSLAARRAQDVSSLLRNEEGGFAPQFACTQRGPGRVRGRLRSIERLLLRPSIQAWTRVVGRKVQQVGLHGTNERGECDGLESVLF